MVAGFANSKTADQVLHRSGNPLTSISVKDGMSLPPVETCFLVKHS